MLLLEKHAKLIVTDSGGVQKEAFYQKTPCIFLFDEKTTWVELVAMGWVTEVKPKSVDYIVKQVKKALTLAPKKYGTPYGKGNSSELMIERVITYLKSKK